MDTHKRRAILVRNIVRKRQTSVYNTIYIGIFDKIFKDKTLGFRSYTQTLICKRVVAGVHPLQMDDQDVFLSSPHPRIQVSSPR